MVTNTLCWYLFHWFSLLLRRFDIKLCLRFASPGLFISFPYSGSIQFVCTASAPSTSVSADNAVRCVLYQTCLLTLYMLSRAKQTATNSVIVLSNGNAPFLSFLFFHLQTICAIGSALTWRFLQFPSPLWSSSIWFDVGTFLLRRRFSFFA